MGDSQGRVGAQQGELRIDHGWIGDMAKKETQRSVVWENMCGTGDEGRADSFQGDLTQINGMAFPRQSCF